MKKTFFLAAAAAAMLSACTKETVDSPETVEAPVFTATIEGGNATIEGAPATRTTLAEDPVSGKKLKVSWEDGDEVKLVFISQDESGVHFSTPIYKATPTESDASKAVLSIKTGETYDPAAAQLLYAVYPAGIDKGLMGLSFPAVQEYKGDGKIGFAPMYFANTPVANSGLGTPSTLHFENTCALLQITVPYSEMTSVHSISVSSDQKMNGTVEYGIFDCGTFYFKSPSDPDIESGENKVTLDCFSYAGANVEIPKDSSRTFYIAIVPRKNDSASPGPYLKYLQIDVTDGTTTKAMRTREFEGTQASGIDIEANSIYPITFAANHAPAGATVLLPGEFSVSATKKVKFTRGNLRCDATTSPATFDIEANQYDFPSTWDSSHIGHFFWHGTAEESYAEEYTTICTHREFWLSGSDAGHTLTIDETSGLYVLSMDEWRYLFSGTEGARTQTNLYAKATVNGVNGVLVFPDGYREGTEVTGKGIAKVNDPGAKFPTENIANWQELEADGVLFLPYAHYRSGTAEIKENNCGLYWSSTRQNTISTFSANAYYIALYTFDIVFPTNANGCSYGRSLRLVKTIE